jgi:hypothetical protein
MLVWIYMIWNAYHFGMQNFGVFSINCKNREQKTKSTLQPPGQARGQPPGQPRGQRRMDKFFF